jgi:hypothetical protein
MAGLDDRWAAGSAYEDYMGRWSRALAARFVAWIGMRPGAHWFGHRLRHGRDDGRDLRRRRSCLGHGLRPVGRVRRVRARALARLTSIVRGRRSGKSAESRGWLRQRHVVARAQFHSRHRHGGAGNGHRCVAGGTVSACVWDYSEGMQFLRKFFDAAVALDDAARAHDEGTRFPLCRPEPLMEAFRGAGLADVRCDPIEIPTAFASFDDFWRPFLAGTGPAPSYVVALLRTDGRRSRSCSSARCPRGQRAIELTARAWAVGRHDAR